MRHSIWLVAQFWVCFGTNPSTVMPFHHRFQLFVSFGFLHTPQPTSNAPKLVAFAAVFGVSPNCNSVEICDE
jgi:hypothetical protein